MNRKFLRACQKKKYRAMSPKTDKWNVPRDIPKDHLAVYVGQYHKRHVIEVSLLKHPLFRALLDHAREVFGFTADSRLCIPCDKNVFLSMVQ